MRRKTIPWKTRYAAELARACPSCGFRHVPYEDAKQMTETQLISLFHLHHNIYHESGHPDRDRYWNLTSMLIKAHREQTKHDLAIIAKGRRIRAKHRNPWATSGEKILAGIRLAAKKRKLQGRGFDKRFTRKMRTGKVVPRKKR